MMQNLIRCRQGKMNFPASLILPGGREYLTSAIIQQSGGEGNVGLQLDAISVWVYNLMRSPQHECKETLRYGRIIADRMKTKIGTDIIKIKEKRSGGF
jgi:hypothetical protein